MSIVDVCNLALSRIGHSAMEDIEDIDEDSEPARACRRVFAITRKTLLGDYRWPHAQKVTALAASAQEVTGYEYVYTLPSDCLKAHAIALATDEQDPTVDPHTAERWPFVLVQKSDGEGKVLATDLEDASLWYTADVEGPEFGGHAFQSALAWKLAAEIALGLKASPEMARNAREMAMFEAEAAALHEVEQQPRPVPLEPATIRTRRY